MEENNCKGKEFCFSLRENFLTGDAGLEQVGIGVGSKSFVTESAKIGIAHLCHLL